jgi:hypothetical protein
VTRKNGSQQRARLWSDASALHIKTPKQIFVSPSEIKKLVARLFVLLGSTSHFTLYYYGHRNDSLNRNPWQDFILFLFFKHFFGRIFTESIHSHKNPWQDFYCALRGLGGSLLDLGHPSVNSC